MNNILEVRDVSLVKGTTTILQNISCTFPEGKVTGILGPSGSGKTSLLRLLNGLDSPSRGQVFYQGQDIAGMAPTRLRSEVGMLLQQSVMFPGTVLDNLTFVPRLQAEQAGREAPSKEQLRELCLPLLEFVGLGEGFCAKEAASLSVGEKQRVALARALVLESRVLLMDEPTSALDRESQRLVEELIKALTEKGRTLVIVTHNLAQARRLTDFVVLLEQGVVKDTGPAEEVLSSGSHHGVLGGCCHD